MQKISYSCIDPIWKLEILDETKIIAEIRNSTNYTCTWKVFDTSKEHCLKSFDTVQNSWWKSIVYSTSDFIVLHELKQGKNPEIKSTEIHYINLNKIDKFDGFQFIGISNSKLHLRNQEGKDHFIQSINKNFVIEESKIYKESSEYFNQFESLILNETGEIPCLECEYLEFNTYILLGYYVKNGNDNYSSNLLIINQEGKKVYYNQSFTELKGAIYGIFFVHSNKIIFTDSNNEIIILNI